MSSKRGNIYFQNDNAPKKGHAHKYLCSFEPVWAVLGRNPLLHVPKMNILVSSINGLLILGHAAPDPSPVAPPENGKPFILETRMP